MRYIVMLIGGSIITYFMMGISELDTFRKNPLSKFNGFMGIIVTIIIMTILFLIFDL